MALTGLIADPDAGVGEIAALLDGLGAHERSARLGGLDSDQQRALYCKAGGSGLDLAYLVPTATPRDRGDPRRPENAAGTTAATPVPEALLPAGRA